jgi:hypothetical protein
VGNVVLEFGFTLVLVLVASTSQEEEEEGTGYTAFTYGTRNRCGQLAMAVRGKGAYKGMVKGGRRGYRLTTKHYISISSMMMMMLCLCFMAPTAQ